MANRDHLKLIRQGRGVWNAWREREPSVEPDLEGAELSRSPDEVNREGYIDAAEIDLYQVDLRGINLDKARLTNTKLNGADLRDAYLNNAQPERGQSQGSRPERG